MLGKLVRYDFKRQWKLLGVVYAIASIMGIGVAILRLLADYTDILVLRYLTTFGTGFCCVVAVVIIVGTWIYALLYFRSNLLKDEGYLMHTLPAEPEQLYFSKLINFMVYVVLSIIVAYLCIGMAFGDIGIYGKIISESIAELPETGVKIWLWSAAYVVEMGIATMILHLGCLIIGYTWRSASTINRDLVSVVIYVILHFVIQIASVALLLLYLLVKYGNFVSQIIDLDQTMDQAASGAAFETEFYSYFSGLLGVSAVTYLIVGVIMLLISLKRFRLKLDLQ